MTGTRDIRLPFPDRRTAGRALATGCEPLADENPIVLGLPRGGVPVAYEVATHLSAPLDVLVVRKLGVPSQPELAMGAIGEDGVRVLNDDVIRYLRLPATAIDRVEGSERKELERRARQFRGDRPMLPVDGRTVVIVDDGLATGSTARAAIQVARAHGARRVALAVPVAPRESLLELTTVADEMVAAATPSPFYAIGEWYRDFRQTSDEEVSRLLADARGAPGRGGRSAAVPGDADRDAGPRP
jgi:predicted phosphoribosyltransferase